MHINKKYFIFPHIITVILLIICYIHFGHQLESIKDSLKKTVVLRAEFFYQHLHLLSAKNSTMKKTIEYNYEKAKNGLLKANEIEDVKYYKNENTYSLAPLDDNSTSHLKGTLTMIDGIKNNTDFISELTAVLSLDPQLNSINRYVNASIWSYYTSLNGYMYLSPVHKIKDFQFTKELYEKPFWSEAQPASNPTNRQIISELYLDGAGQGLMLTISDPVFLNNQFRGVVSIDLGVETMRSFLEIEQHAIGRSYLLDENKYLNACTTKFSLGDTLDVKNLDTKGKWEKSTGFLYFGLAVIPNELYIVHKVTNIELYKAAFFSSLVIIGMLFTIIIVIYFSYFLYKSAKKNKELMQIDPLTKLYNRRGFYTLLEPMFSYLKRTEKECSVIVIDIDFFKNVNDSYGHSIGDEVLESIAHIIKTVNRGDALCARWGGEEFLIFLPETNTNQALKVTQRIHEKINNTEHSKKSLKLSVSIGLYTSLVNDTFDTFFTKADDALYKAKANGRNQTIVYEDNH